MLAQVLQGIARGQRRGQDACRIGQQDLLAGAGGKHPGQAIEGRREIVAVLGCRLTGMDGHPHPQWLERTPVLLTQRDLRGDRRGNRVGNGREGGLRAIADPS